MRKETLLRTVLSFFIVFLLCFGMVSPFSAVAQAKSYSISASTYKNDIVRVDYIHYLQKGQGATRNEIGYKLMGVKWNTTSPVIYYLNTDSIPSNMDTTNVLNAFTASSETWDAETLKELFSNQLNDSDAHYGILDGKNTIEFGAYSGSSNVIAVTSVWINKKTKSIVEFDMLYNTYYSWGNAETAGQNVMDLQNIATHEFGHAIGLSDIYSDTYSYVTMFGYATNNEITKRSLEQPDINGLRAIYGN